MSNDLDKVVFLDFRGNCGIPVEKIGMMLQKETTKLLYAERGLIFVVSVTAWKEKWTSHKAQLLETLEGMWRIQDPVNNTALYVFTHDAVVISTGEVPLS